MGYLSQIDIHESTSDQHVPYVMCLQACFSSSWPSRSESPSSATVKLKAGNLLLAPFLMDLPEGSAAWVCHCGRSFLQQPALNYHKRTCQPSKKHLQGGLAKAKDIWLSRKKRRVDSAALTPDESEGTSDQVQAFTNEGDDGLTIVTEVRLDPDFYPSTHLKPTPNV